MTAGLRLVISGLGRSPADQARNLSPISVPGAG